MDPEREIAALFERHAARGQLPGWAIRVDIRSLDRSLRVFNRNQRELDRHLETPSDAGELLRLWDRNNPEVFEGFLDEVDRLLHNYWPRRCRSGITPGESETGISPRALRTTSLPAMNGARTPRSPCHPSPSSCRGFATTRCIVACPSRVVISISSRTRGSTLKLWSQHQSFSDGGSGTHPRGSSSMKRRRDRPAGGRHELHSCHPRVPCLVSASPALAPP